MFTGLIHFLGVVASISPQQGGCLLTIAASNMPTDLAHGESIAVNGCCLTLVEAEPVATGGQRLAFDVVHQTLRMTTLGSLTPGSRVHLERSATPTTLLGGHLVQGHIDGVGVVINVTKDDGEHRVRIEPPSAILRYITDKGSIAIDGVSLTIADVKDGRFDVALIPTTLQLTTLGELRTGSRVNIETDALAKLVARLLDQRGLGS